MTSRNGSVSGKDSGSVFYVIRLTRRQGIAPASGGECAHETSRLLTDVPSLKRQARA